MTVLTLDNLLGSNGEEKPEKQGRKLSAPSRRVSASSKNESEDSGHEVRNVQVKAACRPSEKPVFEELAKIKGETLSNYIYLYLTKEAKKEGLLSD